MKTTDLTDNTQTGSEYEQYCTFKIGENLFGIPVLDAQEVIKPLTKTFVPLSQTMIRGLINLRGQIVTLIGLRELFSMPQKQEDNLTMNVVVRSDDSLVALVVDEINDVLTVAKESFSKTPSTIDPALRNYVKGIHKLNGQLLIILDLQKILNF